MEGEAKIDTPSGRARRFLEVVAAFSKLGMISFGGPIAHLSYLRAEFVEKRHWLNDSAYGDLVALCQFLPGPASSQVVFGLGMQRAGVLGGILASLSFLLPSAILMILFGYGIASLSDLGHLGWLHGLKLAAVAVVAQAVWGMGRKLCPDRPRMSIGVGAAALLWVAPGVPAQIGVMALGGALGWLIYRKSIDIPPEGAQARVRGHLAAASALGLYGVLLATLPILVSTTGLKWVAVFDSFYRSGALVFGGGHVVLPLLRAEVVPRGWITDAQFLAGYSAAQAIPGPLFTFSGCLGTIIMGGRHAWLGGFLCVLAIFLPGWLLIGGALPFWHTIRAKAWTQAALRGANAAVVGILLAALYTPVFTEGVKSLRDLAAAVIAFCLLESWKAPSWLVVILMAAAGQFVLS
jgi:chromate transporter